MENGTECGVHNGLKINCINCKLNTHCAFTIVYLEPKNKFGVVLTIVGVIPAFSEDRGLRFLNED